ncbi:hypothetical protein NQ318_023477 [Aromia moschata]|uniref:MPN domain-containing protein n=1 Tax=Aromia moschata TaxID=1265417 RepID=A0AAV8YPC3_9CUCU|nr:hypothetical protein NQ318_023477 [Aromia moschata]
MASIKFSGKAFCKMLLHALKYPHCSVNGVLLAKTSSINSKEIEFVDAIPLFHISINLTPMAEIALMQIDEFASKRGLTIAGYYVAPENHLKDNSLEKVHHRIADKIAFNCNSSYLVIVKGTNTSIHMGKVALKVAQHVDGSYKLCEKPSISFGTDDSINACITLLQSTAYNKLIDFDNHLDNLSLDWTNSDLNKEIECLL